MVCDSVDLGWAQELSFLTNFFYGSDHKTTLHNTTNRVTRNPKIYNLVPIPWSRCSLPASKWSLFSVARALMWVTAEEVVNSDEHISLKFIIMDAFEQSVVISGGCVPFSLAVKWCCEMWIYEYPNWSRNRSVTYSIRQLSQGCTTWTQWSGNPNSCLKWHTGTPLVDLVPTTLPRGLYL